MDCPSNVTELSRRRRRARAETYFRTVARVAFEAGSEASGPQNPVRRTKGVEDGYKMGR
jgi:hypothetical protein